MHHTRLRRVTAVNAKAHVRAGDRWRPGTLRVVLAPLPCAGRGQRRQAGDLAIRGLGLAGGRTHDVLRTVACRPFHLPPGGGRA